MHTRIPLVVLFFQLVSSELSFSGNVEVDFSTNNPTSEYNIVRVEDYGKKDIVLPQQLREAGLTVSSWDIKDLRFQFDPVADKLHIGVNCFGICGDADGDGDPGRSSPQLIERGGTDLPTFSKHETALVALALSGFDMGGSLVDGKMDVILGYPPQQATDSEPFPCGDTAFDISCFGLYLYSGTTVESPQTRFLYSTSSGILPHPTVDHNPSTSAARPDLEWTIEDFNVLRAKFGMNAVSNKQTWHLSALAYMGSLHDDGIDEDYLPGKNYAAVVFPCEKDACGVCDGDGSTCFDCAGVSNGRASYDRCDICGGRGRSCGAPPYNPYPAPASGMMATPAPLVLGFIVLLCVR